MPEPMPALMPDPTYEISTDAARLDPAAIHAYLTQSYWSPGIPRAVVERAIAHSVCAGAYCNGTQVGFARMVTDRATFGYLADVYVLEAHRGQGISKRMLTELFRHPDLQGLRRMMLASRDAQGLYARYGFTPLSAPQRLMELLRPNIYRDPTAD